MGELEFGMALKLPERFESIINELTNRYTYSNIAMSVVKNVLSKKHDEIYSKIETIRTLEAHKFYPESKRAFDLESAMSNIIKLSSDLNSVTLEWVVKIPHEYPKTRSGEMTLQEQIIYFANKIKNTKISDSALEEKLPKESTSPETEKVLYRCEELRYLNATFKKTLNTYIKKQLLDVVKVDINQIKNEVKEEIKKSVANHIINVLRGISIPKGG